MKWLVVWEKIQRAYGRQIIGENGESPCHSEPRHIISRRAKFTTLKYAIVRKANSPDTIGP